MTKQSSARSLEQEANAARALRDELAKIPAMDDETVRDTIEGETDLHGAITAVLADINEDEILLVGLAVMITVYQNRKTRVEARIDARKAAVLKAMEIGEIKTLQTPAATVSLRNVARGLDVTDEALVPWDYQIPQPPKIDRKKLKADLAEGKEIPGCCLDNGGVTLSIRRS